MKRLIKAVLKFAFKIAFKIAKKIIPAPWKRRIKGYLIKNYLVNDVVPDDNSAVISNDGSEVILSDSSDVVPNDSNAAESDDSSEVIPDNSSDAESNDSLIISNNNALHIAILLHGGFGDIFISSAWIKEFYRRLDCAVEIDLYALPQHHSLFLLMPYKIRIFDRNSYSNAAGYDLKLVMTHFIRIDHWVPHRIIDKDEKLFELLEKLNAFNNKYSKHLNPQPSLDGEWANLMTKLGRNRWSELNIDGAFNFDSSKGLLHLDIGKYAILDKLGLRGRKYITIHIGSDTTTTQGKQQVKCWPLEHYNKLCELIKHCYPDLIIVQLGAGNSLPIMNIDKNCLSQLDMSESIIVLKHSLLHIDGESGLVHLRRQLHGKTVVLFGPTPIEYFKYAENININSPFPCTNCLWMMNDWYIKCARTGSGYPAQCMEAITSQMVMAEAGKYLDTVLNKKTEITQTALEIYNADSLKNYDSILTDICDTFGVEKLPISQHIFYGDAKLYIHATKQWEYPFAIEKITAYAEKKDKKTLKIADVGGGAGLLAPYLARSGYDTTVYDINYTWDHNGDPERMEKLRLRWAEANGLKMEYGSIFNIPAEDETFDIVTCVSVVEHVPEKIYAFREMLRVLKPSGILIVTYDLVDSTGENSTEAAARIEIFTPELIQGTLSALGIQTVLNHTSADIQKSLDDIKRDDVNIYPGITVGGFVLWKKNSSDYLINNHSHNNKTGKQVIFYGAGNYAQRNIQRLSENGLVPVCFSDKDEKKINTNFCGFEILPLADAVKKYPDCELHLTMNPEKYKDATLYLREYGIPQERIKYTEPYEWRLGCPQLGAEIVIDGFRFQLCCPKNAKNADFFFIPYDNVKDGINKWKELSDELLGIFRNGISGPCEGCKSLSEGIYPLNHENINVLLSSGFKGDLCNVKCIYCLTHDALLSGKKSAAELRDVLTQLVEIYSDKCVHINFADGEFLARQDADEILTYLSDKKNVTISITSNGTIYRESFMKMINLGKVHIVNVSLDSGTQKTYEKIKGRDSFKSVINNLKKYSNKGVHIFLKYIILPELNDNMADIEGFINIAKNMCIGAGGGGPIAADMHNNQVRLPQKTMDMAFKLYDMAKMHEINVYFALEYFNDEDKLLIQKHTKEQ